ncbi:golgin candidate 4 isoform X1 [Dendrobium catenatum]|uniref:Golgin candidate 4 n=1 Tax=Dendrobium catenatum TaxID=906689 RepID=A0A2I0WUF8_9ASPA|nr:golgin candidate 4 isoform X1 [Dendrobium catenatum]PKU79299.1 Golgin candidate 4 [Dendrobium catenatum]
MRNSIASYKESLSRIAHEVLDTAEESSENGPVLARRISQHSSRSAPLQPSSHANGTDHGYIEEIARYRADIQKLQASESEIKALSFNYAALLKEKEEQLRDLQLENGSLRRSLEDRKDDVSLSKDESPRTLSNNSVTPKGDLDRVSLKPRKARTRENSHSGNHALGNSVSKKQNGFDYGSALQNPVVESANSELLYKEREKLLEEVKSLKAAQADHQAEVKLLTEQLDKERANASLLKIKLHEEHERNEASHRELCNLKTDMEKVSETKELQEELDRSLSELRRLQAEVSKKDLELEQNESVDSLKLAMQRLEKEKLEVTTEKNELEKKLNSFLNNKREKDDDDGSDLLNASKSEQNAVKMTSKVRELEEILKETCKERDKALQELSRLKQHLLDKELEDEDKMDEDCKMIEELKTRIEYQRAQILQLENALLQERTRREELKKLKSDELHQSNETIKELKQKLANFISIIDAKNVELQNLQTALGQYYAESEAKERFGRELAAAREESAKYSELLNAASQSLETSKRENEEINVRLSQTERMLSESKGSLHKLEEENSKLRHALERSMTTLNRMSLDSDNFVDRRIVIKLLVTYFQRNHSKEVLDLMVRMLGFSDEDKQRIGFAQHSAGKGVVRGVLGLPGRLVGGILGGSTAQTSPSSSENQSFADLWVDFLLKETEERERRESSEDSQMYSVGQSDSARTSRAQVPNSASVKQYKPSEHSDAEFSTVPLTTATSALPSHKNSQPIRSQRY